MIDIDSKNALTIMKFDMEIAKSQYFDIQKRCWRLAFMKGEMEGVLLKVRRQIMADFYGKNVSQDKTYAVHHFKKVGCKKTAIYRVMQLVNVGGSVTWTESRVS